MNIEKEMAAMREDLRLLTELVKKAIGTTNEQKKYVFVKTTYEYGDCRLDKYLQFTNAKSNIDTANIIGSMAFHVGEATFFTSQEEARKAYNKCDGELNYPKFVLKEVYEDALGLFATKSITN